MAILTCPKCGARNRVEERGENVRAVCGRCGTKLDALAPGGGKPIEITDDNFSEQVLSAKDIPVLVDCWATWCPPCRALAPTIDQLAAESAGKYVIGKLDVDKNQRTASDFKIEAIPTMLIFMNGKLVDRIHGLEKKQAIEFRLAALVA